MYHASCVTEDAADADLIIVELTLNDYTGLELDITQSPSKCALRPACLPPPTPTTLTPSPG